MTEIVTVQMSQESKVCLLDQMDTNELNPKRLLLYAAAKCAGLTLMHIFEKERATPKRVEITISGELSTDKLMPESIFTSFNVIYNVECGSIDEQTKVSRAVTLTHDKYCGLMRMLRMIAPVSHEIAVVSTEPIVTKV
ncbi:MAG: OsmC family protein [Alistipes sp.]